MADKTHRAKLAEGLRLAKRGCHLATGSLGSVALLVIQRRLMFGSRQKKPKDGDEEHRYYLLPGMGRSNRRFRSKIQMWSIIAGIVGSALIGTALWLLNR